jgi:hypothetical protein
MHKKFSCFILLVIVFSMGWAEKPPQAVIDAINSDLTQKANTMLAINGKEACGFKADDTIGELTFSQPFRIYQLNPKLLDISNTQNSIDTLINSYTYNIWYSIVLFGGKAWAIIHINFLEGKYRLSAFSPDPSARDLQQLFRVYQPDEVIIFNAPYFNEYYYHIPKKDKFNLTLLNKKGLSDLSPTESLAKVKSIVETQSDIFTISKNILSRIEARTKREKGGVE